MSTCAGALLTTDVPVYLVTLAAPEAQTCLPDGACKPQTLKLDMPVYQVARTKPYTLNPDMPIYQVALAKA